MSDMAELLRVARSASMRTWSNWDLEEAHDVDAGKGAQIARESTGGIVETFSRARVAMVASRPSLTSHVTSTEAVFSALASQWKVETAFVSSVEKMSMHPAYQRIIGLGPAVLPLILKDLRDDGGHWFWALRSITGEDPVTPDIAGNVAAMRDVWLQWGRQRSYL